jgi:4-amino-4-deoxy-L-arabinose transferase-like glycosyltransferase
MAVLVAGGVSFLGRKKGEKEAWFVTFLVLSSLSTLGAVTGTLAGFSRAPALPSVLPVLSLVGALAIYLISRESGDTRVLVSLCVFCLAFTLWIGAMWGAQLRENFNEYQRSEAYLKQRADLERSVRRYRESLGLPADFEGKEYR